MNREHELLLKCIDYICEVTESYSETLEKFKRLGFTTQELKKYDIKDLETERELGLTIEKTIYIKRNELDYYNKLLTLDLEEETELMEELGAKINDYRSLFSIELNNDYVLTIDLASIGTSNYYDNVVLWKRFNNELVENYCFECEYQLGNDFNFMINEDTYCMIKWEIEE